MKRIIYLAVAIPAFFLSSCGNGTLTPEEEKFELNQQITELETKLRKNTEERIDPKDASEILDLYHTFSDKFPEEEIAPEYLFKAGEVSMGIGNYQRAIGYFERIRKDYPNFDKSPESLFIIGFIYDSYLQQKGKAKEVYEKVIAEYPEHKFAEDAKASINLLTMTDDELIEMFQQKNSPDSLDADTTI